MKTVSQSRYEMIRLAHPNARIESRDGLEVVVIPTYDINTDTAGETVLRLIHDREINKKPEPGDVMRDAHGNLFMIVSPPVVVRTRGPTMSSTPSAVDMDWRSSANDGLLTISSPYTDLKVDVAITPDIAELSAADLKARVFDPAVIALERYMRDSDAAAARSAAESKEDKHRE